MKNILISILAVFLYSTSLSLVKDDNGWMKENWKNSDVPFLRAKDDMKEQLSMAKDVNDVWLDYKDRAKKYPTSAIAQYRLACVIYYGSTDRRSTFYGPEHWLEYMEKSDYVYKAMGKAKSPRCKEYAFMRMYLVVNYQDNSAFLGLAKRFFTIDSKNKTYKQIYASTSINSMTMDGIKTGIALSEDLYYENRNNWQYIYLMTKGHYFLWYKNRSKEEERIVRKWISVGKEITPKSQWYLYKAILDVIDGKI